MSAVRIPIAGDMSLSIYMDEYGDLECVPVKQEGGLNTMVGEPVYFQDATELVDLCQAVRDNDLAVWLYQYEVELEPDLQLVVDNEDYTS